MIRLLDLRAWQLDRFYVAIAIGAAGRAAEPEQHPAGPCRPPLGPEYRGQAPTDPHDPGRSIELAAEDPRRPRPWTTRRAAASSARSEHGPTAGAVPAVARDGAASWGSEWPALGRRRLGLARARTSCSRSRRSAASCWSDSQDQARQPRGASRRHHRRRLREHQRQQQARAGDEWAERGRTTASSSPGRTAVPCARSTSTRHFQRLARDAGLPEIRLHDLRHTNASLALKAGIDIKVVLSRLGHSTTAITADLYTHVDRGVVARLPTSWPRCSVDPGRPRRFLARSLAQQPSATLERNSDAAPSPLKTKAPTGVSAGQGLASSVSTQSAPEGIRTPNLLIRSQMLYPLSYGRMRHRGSARQV